MKHSLKTAETESLKIRMIQRGLTVEALADRCGVKAITISNQIAKNFPSRHLRAVIEQVMQSCFWSDPNDFARRQRFASQFGFDPFVLSAPALRREARKLKLRGRSQVRRRGEITTLLLKQLPSETPTPTHP